MSDKLSIKKLVVKTLTKYNVETVDANSIKSIIVSLGYTVIRFSSLVSSDQTQRLLETLYLDDRIAFEDSFTYNDKERRIVFIRRDISDDEFFYLLAVELGRILTFKTEADGVIGITAQEDRMAHEFAYHICDLSNHGLLYSLYFCHKVPVIFTSFAFTVVLSLIISFFTLDTLHNIDSVAESVENGAATVSEVLTADTLIKQQTEETGILTVKEEAVEYEKEPDNVKAEEPVVSQTYYATKSGKKYHVADCGYISGKDTVAVLQADISSGKYTPCSRCIK